jgi:cyclophilin family peptidyl-prolyl cis-trans isomerase
VFLDHKDNTQKGFGYAVFGEVTKGIEVVDKIAAVKTGAEDVPVKPVIILSVKIKK